MIDRRLFLRVLGLLPALPALALEDPWTPEELMQPASLAERIKGRSAPNIACVAFPVLYRQRHITGSQFAGPGSSPEGMINLRKAAAGFSTKNPIVLYCGCCPMEHCPNIRPAYRELKRLGFESVRVLALPVNFHTDWIARGYPTEPALSE